MIYLDTSALVKRYVAEAGSAETRALIAGANVSATAVITRAEVSAALGRSARMGLLSQQDAQRAMVAFRQDWPYLLRIAVNEPLVARADALALEQGLRGYDAVQLAAAITWQESVGVEVTMATYDRQLWLAAERIGLACFPAIAV